MKPFQKKTLIVIYYIITVFTLSQIYAKEKSMVFTKKQHIDEIRLSLEACFLGSLVTNIPKLFPERSYRDINALVLDQDYLPLDEYNKIISDKEFSGRVHLLLDLKKDSFFVTSMPRLSIIFSAKHGIVDNIEEIKWFAK